MEKANEDLNRVEELLNQAEDNFIRANEARKQELLAKRKPITPVPQYSLINKLFMVLSLSFVVVVVLWVLIHQDVDHDYY